MIIDAGAARCTYVGKYRRTYVHDLADRPRASLEQSREPESLPERWPRRAVVDAGAIPLTERTTIPEELEVLHPLLGELHGFQLRLPPVGKLFPIVYPLDFQ